MLVASIGTPVGAREKLAPVNQAAFIASVEEYLHFVVPICSPQTVNAYKSFNQARDRAFLRSLDGTEYQPLYEAAVRQKTEHDRNTLYHCFGPPPPLDPTKPPPTAREISIAREQNALLAAAAEMPAFFDAGDAAFAKMAALRDMPRARKE